MVTSLVGFAITILLNFLKATIKNHDSATAQKLKVVLTMVRDAITEFLTVFNVTPYQAIYAASEKKAE
jgi:hypothetical protein